MKGRMALLALPPLLALAAGCNGDVFIDEFLEENQVLALDGNGGTAAVHFKSGNWDILNIAGPAGNSLPCQVTGIGTDSEEDYASSAKGLARMHHQTSFLDFTVERASRNRLDISIDENMHEEPYNVIIYVGNDYETQSVSLMVQPSSRYSVDEIVYDLKNFDYLEGMTEVVESFTVDNTSSNEPVSLYVYPYKNVSRTVEFKLYDDDTDKFFLLFGQDIPQLQIPDCDEEGKPYMGGSRIPFVFGQQSLPLDSGLKEEMKKVTVEPHAKQIIEVNVVYERYEAPYEIVISNHGTGRTRRQRGIFSGHRPSWYYVMKRNEDGTSERE